MSQSERSRVDGPVVLCILDGVGIGEGGEDDAVAQADTPVLDALRATCPMLALRAHGPAVGLPSWGDMGNSEVGHNAMGAGRVVDQGAKLVGHALADGSAFDGDLWKDLIACPTLHLLSMVSDGNVHAHVDHLYALIRRAVDDGVRRIRIHALTDGRDVGKRTALQWFEPLEQWLAGLADAGVDARIASGGGRMHLTMDRYEADWAMVARGWRCHVVGEGNPFPSACDAIRALYEADPEVDDQWLPAFVVVDEAGEAVGTIQDGDGVLCTHFRGDRVIEISRAFEEGDSFSGFDRGDRPQVVYGGMMPYDGDLGVPRRALVPPPAIDRTVGHELADAGLRTFACAETQKFGHVTYFFNGNRSGRIDAALEHYEEVTSDVRPFDEAPWMKAAEVTDAVLAAVQSGDWDHVRVNYANGDMVGHTGDLQATKVAMACVDHQLGRLVRGVRKAGGVLLVTADHGNAEQMWQRGKGDTVARDEEGVPVPRTSHSLALVPFVVVDPEGSIAVRHDLEDPGIASIGGTILDLLGVAVPTGWAPTLVRRRPEA